MSNLALVYLSHTIGDKIITYLFLLFGGILVGSYYRKLCSMIFLGE